ncbi:MAG: DUF748 domain-containing protein [Fibromonadaceae bacterium]|nr:DUF748 domain-containing protein [Fibromonadaceae bacterium]
MRVVFAALLVAIAVVLYALFMVYALPPKLKPYLERKIAETIGGEASIGAVEVYPFKLAVAVREFSAENGMAKLVLDSLYADMQLRSIAMRSICLNELRIHGPHFKFAPGQEFSAMQLVAKAFLARTNIHTHIKRFTIQNGNLENFGISPISFSLEDFSTEHSSKEGNNYNLQFADLNGGFFHWNGSLQWSPFYSEGKMEIRNLDVIQWRSFYQEYLPFVLQSGKLDLLTRYKMFEKPEFGFELENAELTLNKAALLADSSNFSAQIASAQVDSLQLSTLNRSLFASNVMLSSADAHYVLRKIPEFPNADMAASLKTWQIKIDSVQARQSQIKLIDSVASIASEHTLNSVQLLLTNIESNGANSINAIASARLNSGKLDLQGTVNLFPLLVNASLNISDFPLTSLQNYLSQETWLNLRQGQANARLSARLRPAEDSLQKDTLVFAGDAEIDSLHLRKNNQELIGAQQIAIKELNLNFAPKISWQMSNVNIQAPVMHLTWFANSLANYSKIKKQKAGPKENKFIPFAIKQINFRKGTLHLTDKDPATSFSYKITLAEGNLRNFSNQNLNANLFVDGKMGGYAPFSLNGQINLSGKHPKLNLAMKASNQDLVAFSPYSGRYVGYRIAKGQVAFEADYAIESNKMQGNNHITVQHLTFGEAVESPEATNLPVRLATALLSDKNGVIDLDVAITGDLDDPEFSVGSLIWKVLKNLLGKAVAAPLKSLMSLIGHNADPEVIAFAPGSGQIDRAQLEVLKNLSQALMQRPELQLDVHGNADSTLDGNALREAQLPFAYANLKNLAHARAQNIKMELVNLNASLGERIFVVDDGGFSGNSANLKIRER